MKVSNHILKYFQRSISTINNLSLSEIEKTVDYLTVLKKRKGRLFLLGVGGSAANCSHAVNDFRKICHIEAYTPTDNISELTARTNDDGWHTVFVEWLKGSRLTKKDAVFILSVGGGNTALNISTNIVNALDYAKKKKSTILGIVSRDGGHTRKVATVCILVPVENDFLITPIAESFQGLIWHAIVNHPKLLA